MREIGDLAADERNAITDGPFGSKLKTEHYTEAGPRVIRLANVGDGVFVDVKTHVSEEHFATLQKHRVFPGDLVIAALGENPPRSCIVPESIGPAIVKADCIRFKPGPMLLPKFANYAINSNFTRRALRGIVHGVGRPRLNLTEIKSIEIPVPPVSEQQRIVAEIEKQFTRLEKSVEALSHARKAIPRYQAATLAFALDDRDTWSEGSIAELVQIIDYRGRTPPLERVGIPHLRSQNIKNGQVVWENLAFVSEETYAQYMTRGLPQPGDILLTTEAPLGEAAMAPASVFSIAQRMMLLRPHPEVLDSRFLLLQLRSPHFQSQLRSSGTGTTVTGVSSRNFKPLTLRFPNLETQRRIALDVDRRQSVVGDLQESVDNNLQRAKNLRQSILYRAFSGNL